MKKSKNLILIFSIVGICLIIIFGLLFWNNDKKQEREFTFQKNSECASYQGKMEEDINKVWKKNEAQILEIFYSKLRNSCIYIIRTYLGGDFCNSQDKNEEEPKMPCFEYNNIVIDYFSKEYLFNQLWTARDLWSCQKTYPQSGHNSHICDKKRTYDELLEELRK